MFTQIRRYWPLLAAFLGIGAYGANYFRIDGIQHLRLVPRPTSHTYQNQQQGLATQQMPWPQSATTSAPPTNPFPTATGITSSDLPVWQDNLSIGDKLAMLEESAGSKVGAPARQPVLPFSSPIPLPEDYRYSANAGVGSLSNHEPSHQNRSQQSFAVDTRLRPVGSNVPSTSVPSSGASATGVPSTGQPATATAAKPGPKFQASDSRINELAERAKGALKSEAHDVGRTIRIASFNVSSLGPSKISKPRVLQTLVGAMRQFDVIALQEIRSSRDDILPLLVDALNQSGAEFDFLVGPRIGREPPYDQFAFVFNKSRVETDRIQLYTVSDPEDLLLYEPLVGWFRCKNAAEDAAFTFSLVNFRLDPERIEEERAIVPALIDAIRSDGRGEDDWILAGDLGGDLGNLIQLGGTRFAIRDMPTDVAGTRLLDTIFFSANATGEFTGKAGSYDFLRKSNLSLESALEVSDHLPIWAEFSVLEGEQPGRLAPVDPLVNH